MYTVRGAGAAEYGPVDIETLQLWVSERRIQPESCLFDLDSGETLPAHRLIALQPIFSALAEPPPVFLAEGHRPVGSPRGRRLRRVHLVAALAPLVILLTGYVAGRAGGDADSPLLSALAGWPRTPLEGIREPEPLRPKRWPYPDGTSGTILPAPPRASGEGDQRPHTAPGATPAYRYSPDWERRARYLLDGDVDGVLQSDAALQRRKRLIAVPAGVEARIVDHKAVFPFYLYKVRFTSGPHEGRTAWLEHRAFHPKPRLAKG